MSRCDIRRKNGIMQANKSYQVGERIKYNIISNVKEADLRKYDLKNAIEEHQLPPHRESYHYYKKPTAILPFVEKADFRLI